MAFGSRTITAHRQAASVARPRDETATLESPDFIANQRTTCRPARLSAIAAALLPLGWLASFASGLAPWLGSASVSTSSFGLPGGSPPFSIIGHDEVSSSFGLDTMLLFAGQEFFVRYEARMRTGMLVVSFGPPTRKVASTQYRYVRSSGAGEIVFRVPKTGIYEFQHDASPDGRGYDLDYRVTWGARPAR